jgi:uncharacterized membrane protein
MKSSGIGRRGGTGAGGTPARPGGSGAARCFPDSWQQVSWPLALALSTLSACTSPPPSSREAPADTTSSSHLDDPVRSARRPQQQDVGTDTAAGPPADTVDRYFEGSRRVWEEARARGITFRAIGQEPGWVLEIIEGRTISLLTNHGEDELVVPAPRAMTSADGRVVTYHAVTEAHDVRILIRAEPCSDAMSGERFSTTVEVLVDGVTYHGCGRMMDRLP